MTTKDYIKMIQTECGETISVRTAKLMMERDAEHEAEAILGGKYDVDPELEAAREAESVASKPFKIVRETPMYHPSTDGYIGCTRRFMGGYDSREQAETALQAMGFDDEVSMWIEPRKPFVHPLSNPTSLDECPF